MRRFLKIFTFVRNEERLILDWLLASTTAGRGGSLPGTTFGVTAGALAGTTAGGSTRGAGPLISAGEMGHFSCRVRGHLRDRCRLRPCG